MVYLRYLMSRKPKTIARRRDAATSASSRLSSAESRFAAGIKNEKMLVIGVCILLAGAILGLEERRA